MADLWDIEVGQLSGYDVGRRLVVTSDGVAFDGVLTALDFDRSDYDFKDRDRITASIVVKRIELAESVGRSDKTLAEIRLTKLPLDYMLQREIPGAIRIKRSTEDE